MYRFTKQFRTDVLGITLSQMSEHTGVKVGTISAFENGRSTNYNLILNYYKMCESDSQRREFLRQLTQTIKENY